MSFIDYLKRLYPAGKVELVKKVYRRHSISVQDTVFAYLLFEEKEDKLEKSRK